MDIFHYLCAVLHHPEYRERYAANLRRELPCIPFVTATPGAKPLEKAPDDAALKRRSSTLAPKNDGTDVKRWNRREMLEPT